MAWNPDHCVWYWNGGNLTTMPLECQTQSRIGMVSGNRTIWQLDTLPFENRTCTVFRSPIQQKETQIFNQINAKNFHKKLFGSEHIAFRRGEINFNFLERHARLQLCSLNSFIHFIPFIHFIHFFNFHTFRRSHPLTNYTTSLFLRDVLSPCVTVFNFCDDWIALKFRVDQL